MIRYLEHKEIDRLKWDRAVSGSCHETAYGYAWFLDLVAGSWDGLVEDDYRAVMPLPWKSRYGFRFVYQPVNCQQLGVFAPDPPDEAHVRTFLDSIPRSFRMVDVHLNSHNRIPAGMKGVKERKNYCIDLNRSYEEIARNYHNNARRNLARASTGECTFAPVETGQFLRIMTTAHAGRHGPVNTTRMKKIVDGCISRGRARIDGAWLGESLCAAVFWVFSETRSIYMLSASDDRGKEQRAMFSLVDRFIRDHQNNGTILDFEGSVIPSVARFFEGFDAEQESYHRVRIHRSLALKILTAVRS